MNIPGRGNGRDEKFQRELAQRAKAGAGGVVLGEERPQPPARTYTEITFQGCTLGLVRLTNDQEEVVGYQIRVMDPLFNRVYIYPMSKEQGEQFGSDYADLLSGKTDEEDTEATATEDAAPQAGG